jgi:putative membrane protein
MDSKDDHERIAKAIRAVEAKTTGEIVCVLAKSSTHGTAMPVLLASAAALALPWLLMAFTEMTVERMLSLQVLTFVLLLLVLGLPRIRVSLLPRKTRRAIAHRAAMEQFVSRGIAHNKDHAGILIFVSLAERYARIIVDDEVAGRVQQSEWQAAIDQLVAHMSDGRIADGFVSAIEACGNVLARYFPSGEQSADRLPDRLHVI